MRLVRNEETIMVSPYLNRVRSDEEVLDDLREALAEAERACESAEARMLAADEVGEYGAYDHAANAYDHWEHEAARLRREIDCLEEHVALREAARDRAYHQWRTL